MNVDRLMQQDTLSRQRIVSDIRSNFFVEASAGSGKTTILVKRMVAMVEQGLEVSEICAITFTKAAAGEFYDRFQKLLIQRSTAPTAENYVPQPGELGNPTDETRKRCLKALNNLDLCFMGTTDAFCNMILSEHPARAGIPSNAELLSKEDMLPHYKRIYSQIQRGEHGAELQQLCRKFRAFYSNPHKTFAGAMGVIMDTRNCEHIFDPLPEGNLDALLKEEKTQLLSVLRKLLEHPELKYMKAKTDGPAWEALEEKENLLFGSWDDSILPVMKALDSIKRLRLIPEAELSVLGPAGSTVFEPHFSRDKLAWYNFSENGLTDLYNKLQAMKYSATMAFLTAAAERSRSFCGRKVS